MPSVINTLAKRAACPVEEPVRGNCAVVTAVGTCATTRAGVLTWTVLETGSTGSSAGGSAAGGSCAGGSSAGGSSTGGSSMGAGHWPSSSSVISRVRFSVASERLTSCHSPSTNSNSKVVTVRVSAISPESQKAATVSHSPSTVSGGGSLIGAGHCATSSSDMSRVLYSAS